MTTPARAPDLALGPFAGDLTMVALDQRESLRVLLSRATGAPASDEDLRRFKVDVAGALSPYASALLIDPLYGLAPIREANVLDPHCALLVAADCISYDNGRAVRSSVREDVKDRDWAAEGAKALKFLLIWSEEDWFGTSANEVSAFVADCRDADVQSLIEVVVRERDGSSPSTPKRHAELLLSAAQQVARLRPDLYKTEVPFLGKASAEEIIELSELITGALDCPWVVLSSGIEAEAFPSAVRAACSGGASGFLAGRAIWGPAIGADTTSRLQSFSVPRLRELTDVVRSARGDHHD